MSCHFHILACFGIVISFHCFTTTFFFSACPLNSSTAVITLSLCCSVVLNRGSCLLLLAHLRSGAIAHSYSPTKRLRRVRCQALRITPAQVHLRHYLPMISSDYILGRSQTQKLALHGLSWANRRDRPGLTRSMLQGEWAHTLMPESSYTEYQCYYPSPVPRSHSTSLYPAFANHHPDTLPSACVKRNGELFIHWESTLC